MKELELINRILKRTEFNINLEKDIPSKAYPAWKGRKLDQGMEVIGDVER